MFKDIAFGQYYPTSSFVHNLDPRIKLLLTVLFIVTIFFIQTSFSFLVTLVFLLVVILFSRVPVLSVLKSVKGILFLVLFAAIINLFFVSTGEVIYEKVITDWWTFRITWDGVHNSIKLTLRLIFLITGASIISLTTTPMRLTDGIESLLKPLKVIKFPVHDIAIIMSIALRFIPTLLDETHKIINAQKARGAAFDTGGLIKKAKSMLPVLIPLFVSAFRRADELAFAMDARCYNATEKRTKMRKLKLGWRDLIATLFVAGYATFIFVDRYYFLGLDHVLFPGVF